MVVEVAVTTPHHPRKLGQGPFSHIQRERVATGKTCGHDVRVSQFSFHTAVLEKKMGSKKSPEIPFY